MEESGDPTGFNAAHWVAGWLSEPLTALGGRPPADLMDTAEGRPLVLASSVRCRPAPTPEPTSRMAERVLLWRIATDAPNYQADDGGPRG